MKLPDILLALEKVGNSLRILQPGDALLNKAEVGNKWFTPESQMDAIHYWANVLNVETLSKWLTPYSFAHNAKKVGLVMAGNIPLVGLHDLLCVLVSGHKALVKPSSDDTILMTWLIEELIKADERLKDKIESVNRLNTCEALIATGSNNTSRYFDYYFKSVPRIIRKNRNSLAVLQGNETAEDLSLLADDIFMYFGMGCRNVSKLFVPEKYNFKTFFEAMEIYNASINHTKYYNNYTYHKALFLMNMEPHLDNGFLLLKEDDRLHSPLGCIFFSYYKERNEIIEYIDQLKESIQIVVGNPNYISECVPFGQSQYPKINEYADEIDTMHFLNHL